MIFSNSNTLFLIVRGIDRKRNKEREGGGVCARETWEMEIENS